VSNTGGDFNGEKNVTTRFNIKGFTEVIQALDEEKKEMIRSHGFGSLLDFACSSAPVKFAAWICLKLNCRLGDIIVNNKSIKLSPESVHDVLGLPLGGRDILRSSEDGKALFFSRADRNKLSSVYEQREKLKRSDLGDDEFMRTFLAVALSYFLCPSAGVVLSPKYLGPLVDIKTAKDWDWSKLVYDWVIKNVARFQKRCMSSSRDSVSLPVCLYYICVSSLCALCFLFLL
jgi:hypothetical protein